jgi:hypothetical protein
VDFGGGVDGPVCKGSEDPVFEDFSRMKMNDSGII